jgi:hypothetical protein
MNCRRRASKKRPICKGPSTPSIIANDLTNTDADSGMLLDSRVVTLKLYTSDSAADCRIPASESVCTPTGPTHM